MRVSDGLRRLLGARTGKALTGLTALLLIGAAPAALAAPPTTITTTISGTSSGTSNNTNTAGCPPVCNFTSTGTYLATGIGGGTYTGHLTLNYANYATNGHCADVTGAITFTDTTHAGSTITTNVAPGSLVCETAPVNGAPHSTNLILTITGGTGVYAGATGIIYSKGTTTDTGPETHLDNATLRGNITTQNLVGPPTDKDQCKNGGWQNFNNPSFRNQGDCVSYVNHHNGHGNDDSGQGEND